MKNQSQDGISATAATDALRFAPDSLVAGSVPLARGADPLKVAYHAAAYALDSDRLRLIHSAHGDQVHYLAALASDFAAQGSEHASATALGAALDLACSRAKGSEPIAVLETDEGGTTAVVLAEGKLQSYRGYTALIQQHLQDRFGQLELRDLSLEPPAWVWQGYRELQDQAARRVRRASLAAAATLAGAALLGLAFVSQLRGPGRQPAIAQANDTLAASVSQAVQRANAPVLSAAHTFFEVQRLSALASESGGRIQRFVQDNNRVAWELQLPTWVTPEMLSQLGSDIRVKRDGNWLQVRRGVLDRDDESAISARRAERDTARGMSPNPAATGEHPAAAPAAAAANPRP